MPWIRYSKSCLDMAAVHTVIKSVQPSQQERLPFVWATPYRCLLTGHFNQPCIVLVSLAL